MSKRVERILGHLDLRVNNVLGDNPIEYKEKIAFKMYLNPGQIEEYKRRHDLIPKEWPELSVLLTNAGIRDYSIFFDQETDSLFAVLWRTKNNKMDQLPNETIMKNWWKYMSVLMKTKNGSNEPIAVDLPCVFHME